MIHKGTALTLTFGLEGEVAVDTVVRPDIGVSADVFAQHARFLTANSTFLTDVFSSPAATHINVLLVRFVSVGVKCNREAQM